MVHGTWGDRPSRFLPRWSISGWPAVLVARIGISAQRKCWNDAATIWRRERASSAFHRWPAFWLVAREQAVRPLARANIGKPKGHGLLSGVTIALFSFTDILHVVFHLCDLTVP